MQRNSYTIQVEDKTLEDFEFIAGPMAAISIPQPPRAPETFISACFRGGATPITAPRDADLELYMQDALAIKKNLMDCYIGANIFAPWGIAAGFIKAMGKQKDPLPDFIDINAIELNFEEIMPLLKEVEKPIYLGFNQPISIYTFKKYLQTREYSYLVDRMAEGKLKLYLPQNHGGGHLPILKEEQAQLDWTADLLQEVLTMGKEFNLTVPFIVEKGMLSVDDFVGVIRKYAEYPGFSGVRFASLLELTQDSGLNRSSKDFLVDMLKNNRREMIIPIRSVIGANKIQKSKRVRGGVISYVAATKLAKKIHEVQSDGAGFPKFSRPYRLDAIITQIETAKKNNRVNICERCIPKCPKEYCELGAAWESVVADGSVDTSLLHISPRIFDIDPEYIDAPTDFVVRDTITKVLAHFN